MFSAVSTSTLTRFPTIFGRNSPFCCKHWQHGWSWLTQRWPQVLISEQCKSFFCISYTGFYSNCSSQVWSIAAQASHGNQIHTGIHCLVVEFWRTKASVCLQQEQWLATRIIAPGPRQELLHILRMECDHLRAISLELFWGFLGHISRDFY